MFKNKLPISSLISIVVISIGAFFILLFLSLIERDHLEESRYFFLMIGLLMFSTGIALIIRKTWARTILAFSLFILTLILLFEFQINMPSGDIYTQIALVILPVSIPLFLILLLYNEKVSIEFGDKHIDKETEDVLDHFK